MTEPSGVVLDSSALLAYFRNEVGAERVREALRAGAVMSAVNWAETLARLATLPSLDALSLDRELREQGVAGDLLVIVPVTHDDAVVAADLARASRHLGLSLGDRCCLAISLRLGFPVITADRAWARLSMGVPMTLIR